MNKQNKSFTLNSGYYKILHVVDSLNQNDDYPLPQGVYKILKGTVDEETKKYQNLDTFGSSISYTSKKVSRFVTMLIRYDYLKKKYDPSTDELYLEITPLGTQTLRDYFKKRRSAFLKKNVLKKKTIVHLPQK